MCAVESYCWRLTTPQGGQEELLPKSPTQDFRGCSRLYPPGRPSEAHLGRALESLPGAWGSFPAPLLLRVSSSIKTLRRCLEGTATSLQTKLNTQSVKMVQGEVGRAVRSRLCALGKAAPPPERPWSRDSRPGRAPGPGKAHFLSLL